jgi:predicted Zn-dependent peptidase
MELKETILDSGLTVITEKIEHAPAFALGITIKAGASDSPREKEGIAHNLEHLVFRRANDEATEEIAKRFESAGGYMNAFTTHESTTFYVRGMNSNFDRIFVMLCELITQAEFDEKANEKEQGVILEEISADSDEPGEYIFDEADRFMFGQHSYGNNISGSEETLDSISVDDLRNFFETYYCLKNIVLTAVGNVNHELISELADRYLTLPQGIRKGGFTGSPKAITAPSELILRKQVSQSHVVLGSFFGRRDRKFASLASVIVADGMSSRLYQEIRERRGLAYAVYSSLQNYSQCGVFYIYSACAKKNVDKLLKAIEGEYDKLRSKGITYEEYARTIEMVKTGFAMDMEDLSARLIRISRYIVFDAKAKTIYDEEQAYTRISYEELNSYIMNHFNKENVKRTILLGE